MVGSHWLTSLQLLGQMNRFFVLFFLFLSSASLAQRPSFVYIQTEPAQPFVVTLEEQVYKSSQSGYLILSKLTDTAYSITVSFPGTQWPSQYFSLQVNHTDKGYLLKDFGDKGWGLMDWQKLTTQFSRQPIDKNEIKLESKPVDDDFASLLAKASGDPSLISPVKAAPKDTSIKVSDSKDSVMVDRVVVTPTTTSVVTRRAESSTTEGFGLVYVDTYSNGQSDTIRLIIPNKTEKVEIPAHCKEVATDEQVTEFRKQLIIAATELKMIAVAKQVFSMRCYTTAQVRELSSNFLTDQGKYDFLLEAWLSLSDKRNMLSLVSVFSSKEMADRFKELLQ